MDRYLIALIYSLVGLAVLAVLGLILFLTQSEETVEIGKYKIGLILVGGVLWSGLQTLGILSLIGVDVISLTHTQKNNV
jgi:hypothetical protein